MIAQKTAAGLALLTFNAVMLGLAFTLPSAHSRGDVGTAFLPSIIAVAGILLALFYLASVLRGADTADNRVTLRGIVFMAIFVLATVLMTWIGLPAALALAAGAAVFLSEKGKHLGRAIIVSIGVALLAQFGFGGLLNVPLP